MPNHPRSFTAFWGMPLAACLAACGRPGGGAAPAAPVVAAPAAPAKPVPELPVSYNRDIRPILVDNCFGCHGADSHELKGGLSLIAFDRATARRKGHVPAIVPGDPQGSELVERILDGHDPMPPKDSHRTLTARQKDLLVRWVAQGAAYQPHWSDAPPRMTPTPQVADKAWPLSFADNYVLARLEAEGITPAPEADRAALCFQLHQDLIGAAPGPEQTAAFLADARPDAYERLVDRLLADPRHADRMAAHWMRLVNYSNDDCPPGGSPYRDWVAAAFLGNMPHDRFIRWQVAGDLLEGLDADGRNDALLASCFNHPVAPIYEGGSLAERTAILQAERVRNVSQAFMGCSLVCCQCHDHKYDPHTLDDFYALDALFADVRDAERAGPRRVGAGGGEAPREGIEMDLVSPLDRLRQAQLREAAAGEKDAERRTALIAQADAIPRYRVRVDRASPPRQVRALALGNWRRGEGPPAVPQVPSFFGSFARLGIADRRPDRLDFARWLTTPAGQGGCAERTARVWVNHLWGIFHGRGLCPSVYDFGGQGDICSHPELLDRLALEFVQSGWDNRRLIRLLVTSRAYRLTSAPTAEAAEKDPQNLLFGRQSGWRSPEDRCTPTMKAIHRMAR